jgi:hypothetical protein
MYKFKSRVSGDLIMLEPNGRHILRIIGKEDSVSSAKGILLPKHMAAAIAALQAAVAAEEAELKQREEAALAKGETPPRREGVSLRQRATPFIAMIQRCQKADVEIVWGV